MQVRVSYWGKMRRLAGCETQTIELSDGADIDTLIVVLGQEQKLLAALDECAFSIGTKVVTRSHSLVADDEVAILPPVSGG